MSVEKRIEVRPTLCECNLGIHRGIDLGEYSVSTHISPLWALFFGSPFFYTPFAPLGLRP